MVNRGTRHPYFLLLPVDVSFERFREDNSRKSVGLWSARRFAGRVSSGPTTSSKDPTSLIWLYPCLNSAFRFACADHGDPRWQAPLVTNYDSLTPSPWRLRLEMLFDQPVDRSASPTKDADTDPPVGDLLVVPCGRSWFRSSKLRRCRWYLATRTAIQAPNIWWYPALYLADVGAFALDLCSTP